MKKFFLLLISFIFVLGSYAQGGDLNLSNEQIAKIKKINREIGSQFKTIGQSNLSGYEKGQRKRALAIEHKAAIKEILNENQLQIWEDYYGSMDQKEGLRDIIKDGYDIRLDNLEKKYEKEKRDIEESALSKDRKKTELKNLKENYKSQKKRLKAERDRNLERGVLGK